MVHVLAIATYVKCCFEKNESERTNDLIATYDRKQTAVLIRSLVLITHTICKHGVNCFSIYSSLLVVIHVLISYVRSMGQLRNFLGLQSNIFYSYRGFKMYKCKNKVALKPRNSLIAFFYINWAANDTL